MIAFLLTEWTVSGQGVVCGVLVMRIILYICCRVWLMGPCAVGAPWAASPVYLPVCGEYCRVRLVRAVCGRGAVGGATCISPRVRVRGFGGGRVRLCGACSCASADRGRSRRRVRRRPSSVTHHVFPVCGRRKGGCRPCAAWYWGAPYAEGILLRERA